MSHTFLNFQRCSPSFRGSSVQEEGEALDALSVMDFRRTLFYLYRESNRPHLFDWALHIFSRRRKQVGLSGLLEDLLAGPLEGLVDPGVE